MIKHSMIDYEDDDSLFEAIRTNSPLANDLIRQIDICLENHFQSTLTAALHFKRTRNLHLIPSIILVRAAVHPDRPTFNQAYPMLMRYVGWSLTTSLYDIVDQFSYYVYLRGSKRNLPNILKKIWRDKLTSEPSPQDILAVPFTPEQLLQFSNESIQHQRWVLDISRVCHANVSVYPSVLRSVLARTYNDRIN